MKILKISFDNKNKEYEVITESEVFHVKETTLIKFNLYEGKIIDEKMTYNFSYFDKIHTAKKISLKYLKNLKTEYELREKLKSLNTDNEIIDEVVQYMYELKLLDDLDYAISYSLDKSNFNRWSKNKIKFKLKEKGISDEFINAALYKISDETELFNIRKDKEIKEKSLRDDDKNRRAKLINYLYRKGYSINLINKIIDE